MSIDRSLLYKKIKDRIHASASNIHGDISMILMLIRKTLFNNPVNGCIMKCNRSEWLGLPLSKSLFHTPANKGLPIGNLTSQLFANIYLDEFDHFIKQVLRLKYYGRYVDDMVIVHKDKHYLRSIIPEIKQYLSGQLMLELHPRKIYLQHCSKGVTFLGVIIKPYRSYISSRTKANFYSTVNECNKEINEEMMSKTTIKKTEAKLNSYLGILQHYSTFRLRRRMIETYLSLKYLKLIRVSAGYKKVKVC